MKIDHITGAELQTIREACGLSRDDLAALVGVQARTIKHWESGRASVPADVVATLERIETIIRMAVRNVCDNVKPGALGIVLIRYRPDSDDLMRDHPEFHGLPASVHGAIIGQIRTRLAATQVQTRVVWMDSAAYDTWRSKQGFDNTEAARVAWAAGQVTTQALPHRADQPPPSH